MKDLLVNFVGAVVFSTLGMVYLKSRGKGGRFLSRFIPRLKTAELPPRPRRLPAEAPAPHRRGGPSGRGGLRVLRHRPGEVPLL